MNFAYITLLDIFYKYENNSPVIYLTGRMNKDRKRIYLSIHDFFPYFYIKIDHKTNSLELLDDVIHNNVYLKNWVVDNIKIIDKINYFRGKKVQVCKIVGKSPHEVPKMKKIFDSANFECFEFDIPFVHRFLIDSGIRCSKRLKFNIQETNVNLNQNNEEIAAPIQITYNKIQEFLSLGDLNKSSNSLASMLVASIDIETGNSDDISFQELISKKKYYIIAISISFAWYTDSGLEDITTKSFILKEKSASSEKLLLNNFLTFLNNLDPDVVVSFNGDNFDYDYIIHRLNLFKLKFKLGKDQLLVKSTIDGKYRMPGKAFVDLYPKAWSIHTKSGRKRLVDIAEFYFQDSNPDKLLKLDIPELPGDLWNTRKIELLKEYVEQDTIITLELVDKMLAGDLAVAQVNGAPYSDALLATGRVSGEFELMRILFENNTLIPHKPDQNQVKRNKEKRKEHPHTGGQVITPKEPNAKHVIIADFVSMYPTLMSSKNVGSESFIAKGKFRTTPRTTLAILQEKVIEKRMEVKKLLKQDIEENLKYSAQKQQFALKIVANSMYGATLYVQGRFFDIEVCNSITDMARKLMNEIFSLTNDFAIENNIQAKVIYSDTDSVFIQLVSKEHKNIKKDDSDVFALEWLQEYQKKLLTYLNSKVPYGMELNLEDIAKRIIFQKMSDKGGELRKKAYAYYSLLYDKLVIKGFEAIRSDLSEFTKKTQEEIFYILLNKESPTRKANSYLKERIKKLYSTPNDKLIPLLTVSGIIRRPPNEYKSKTPAVGAFLEFCQINSYNPTEYYLNFPRFPYIITTKGKRSDPLFKKSSHPKYVMSKKYKIDLAFYQKEILRIAEKFDLINPVNVKSKLLVDYL